MVNDDFYIDNIFNYIKSKWPMLFEACDGEKSNYTRRKKLYEITYYNGTTNNFDEIIKHIIKNEHMIDFWLL